MALQDRMNRYKKDFEAKAPAAALAVMHRAARELAESGILNRAIKIGDRAPEFTLKNTRDQEIRLEDLIRRGPAVLSFYRGRW